MNETNLPEDYTDTREWQQAEMMRDEAWRQHEVENAFERLLFKSPYATTKDWELLAQALEDRFPGFLKFYRSL